MRSPPTSILKKTAFWFSVVVVTVLSLLPVAYLPPQTFNIWDKAQHAGGFLVLTLLGRAAYLDGSLARLGTGLLLYGAAIEMAQAATGWRTGDVLDLLADGVGIFAALVVCRAWGWRNPLK